MDAMFSLLLVGLFLVWSPTPTQTGKQGKDTLRCNQTSDGHDFLGRDHPPQLAKAIGLREAYIDQPVSCVYTFLGVAGQRILLHLHKFKVGEYDDRTRGCHRGYLRMWDGLNQAGRHPYPPNTLCGSYNSKEIDVWKYTTDHSARLEFYTERLLRYTKFKLTYQYISIDNTAANSSIMHHDMHLVSDAVCDWRVTLDACQDGACDVVSPGFPGIYPPNTECRYRVRGPPGTMTKLHFESFNLVESKDCKDHWLRVYSGNSARSPLVGQYCGTEIPEVTVAENELYMTFNSGLDRPPYSYTGFHAKIQSLPASIYPSGKKEAGTLCDWTFNVTEESVKSPDHFLPPLSQCSYKFIIPKGQLLEVALSVNGLDAPCEDSIEIYENTKPVESLCSSRLDHKPNKFFYTLAGEYGIVRYYRANGQIGSSKDRGFWLSVRLKKDTRKRKNAEPAFQFTSTDSACSPSWNGAVILSMQTCLLFRTTLYYFIL